MRIRVSRFLVSWWCAVEDSIHKSKEKHLRSTKHIIIQQNDYSLARSLNHTQTCVSLLHTYTISESEHRLKQTMQWIVSQVIKCALTITWRSSSVSYLMAMPLSRTIKTESNFRIINELWIEVDSEGNGRDIFQATITEFASVDWKMEKNFRIISVRPRFKLNSYRMKIINFTACENSVP
jgi:hypothetical protein